MKFAELDTVITLLEIELIAPLNTAGRVNGIEINESEFAGKLKAVKPTGSVAAEVVEVGVSLVIGSTEFTGRTVVVDLGFTTVWPEERGAPANEIETAPNSTVEEKREGNFMG